MVQNMQPETIAISHPADAQYHSDNRNRQAHTQRLRRLSEPLLSLISTGLQQRDSFSLVFIIFRQFHSHFNRIPL
jgi:hypothetical protein